MLPFTEQFILQETLKSLEVRIPSEGPLWTCMCDAIYYECSVAFREYIKQLKIHSKLMVGDLTQYYKPQKEVFGIIINLDVEPLELQFYREHVIRLARSSFLIIPMHPLFSFELNHAHTHSRLHLYIPIYLSE